MLDQAHIGSRIRGDFLVLEIRGDVDARNAHRLRAEFERAAARSEDVVISLEHAIYFDSLTMGLIMHFARRAALSGRCVSLAVPPHKPLHRLCLTFGLFKLMPVYPSLASALADRGKQAGVSSAERLPSAF